MASWWCWVEQYGGGLVEQGDAEQPPGGRWLLCQSLDDEVVAVLARDEEDHLGEDATASVLLPAAGVVGAVGVGLAAQDGRAFAAEVDLDEGQVEVAGAVEAQVGVGLENLRLAEWPGAVSPAGRLGLEGGESDRAAAGRLGQLYEQVGDG